MRTTLVLAKREFISFFASPVALAFLGLFLVGQLVKFFYIDYFFSYGLADVRSLFANMPLMLIILVGALTMKLWSEEQKQGTLELLMTLPLSNFQLVIGKFLAGWAFIGVALLFTLGLPITVAEYGPLDWGPVWGGYFASFLLGGAYLAIGLCISSLTDNQVLSLMLTITVGLVFYILGEPGVAETLSKGIAGVFGSHDNPSLSHRIEDVILKFGTGSRFKSIEKGLLDNRDIFWYSSIMLFFLVLNAFFLNIKRQLQSGSMLKLNSLMTVFLVGMNLIVLNIAMDAQPLFRIDLTEEKQFSLSQETVDQIAELDEELTVELVFSDKMPANLRPLVPQIKDLVHEYQLQSGGRLRLVLSKDPNQDDKLKRGLMMHYGVEPVGMIEKTAEARAVIQTYFHIIIRYGDKFQVLGTKQLVEQHNDENGAHFSLRNLEYAVSRGIRDLFHQFQNFESVFSRIDKPLVLRLYYPFRDMAQAGKGAENFKNYLNNFREVVDQITEYGKEGFDFKEVDYLKVATKENWPPLFRRLSILGITPEKPIIITLQYEDRAARIEVDLKANVQSIYRDILSKAQGMLPGFKRTVGLWVPGPASAKQAKRMQTGYRFQRIQGFLSTFVNVKRIDFEESKGVIPDGIDLLLVLGVENASLVERFAMDQFLMQGKPVIYAAGYSKLVDFSKRDPAAKPIWNEMTYSKDLGSLIRHYGAIVESYVAQDARCMRFVNYRKFKEEEVLAERGMIDVRHPELSPDHDATRSLRAGVLMAWASPLKLDEQQEGIEVLARTTKQSWKMDLDDLRSGSESAFIGHQPLAATITGERGSFFAASEVLSKALTPGQARDLELLKSRQFHPQCDNVRLVVIGSHDFISDMGWAFIGSAAYRDSSYGRGFRLFPEYATKLHQNMKFIGNLVDWGLKEDTLKRRPTATARLLLPMDKNEKWNFKLINAGIVFTLLAFVLLGFWMLRRLKKPMIKFPKEMVL
jgi:ABC-2 type transport system permease protein